jgi:hypothetical protein
MRGALRVYIEDVSIWDQLLRLVSICVMHLLCEIIIFSPPTISCG